jgi:hypothetical protein
MYSKQHEIEAVIEDLIENNILEMFRDVFSNKKECEVALEILQTKLEELDVTVFKNLFD